MTEQQKGEPFLSADFGEQGGRMEWMSLSDLQQWSQALQNDWSWIRHAWNPGSNAYDRIVNGLNQPLNILHQAQTYKNQGNEPQFLGTRQSGQQSLENFLKSYPWLLPNSALRQFLAELRGVGGSNEAALIPASLLGADLNGAPIRPVVWALVQLELYERGIKDRLKVESASLKRLVGDIQTKLTGLQEEERKQISRFDETHQSLAEQSGGQSTEFHLAQEQRDGEWKKQVDAARVELNRLQDTYDSYMSLAAPVKYWQAKRVKHRNWMFGSGALLVIAMVFSGWFLHSEINSIGQAATLAKKTDVAAKSAQIDLKATLPAAASSVPHGLDKADTSSKSGAATQVAVSTIAAVSDVVEVAASWRLGSFILLATLLFWLLRILVRIFLSNMHLENDAAERVTMAKTYLALLRKGRLPDKENISAVLAALFRPSGDGIVKDEGVPPTTLDWFTKMGNRG